MGGPRVTPREVLRFCLESLLELHAQARAIARCVCLLDISEIRTKKGHSIFRLLQLNKYSNGVGGVVNIQDWMDRVVNIQDGVGACCEYPI